MGSQVDLPHHALDENSFCVHTQLPTASCLTFLAPCDQLGYTPRIPTGKQYPVLAEVPASERLGGHLIKTEYQMGVLANLISRDGMEAVINRHFTNRTRESTVLPSFIGSLQLDEGGYFHTIMTENFVVMPPMFITHARASTIPTGEKDREDRSKLHADYNAAAWLQWPPELQDAWGFDSLSR
jgi:hypothetical protein